MIFYVCSYGGCGSTILSNKLSQYGEVKHIHSRKPPDKLCYVGDTVYKEWFNSIEIPENELNNYKVIYIYRNPIDAIYSRFIYPKHLLHIQTNIDITLEDVVNTKKDLYGIEEFFDNYTTKNENRNYKIYAIKYEELFEKQDELSSILNIDKLSLEKRESYKIKKYKKELSDIYSNLINKIDKMKTIEII